MSNNCISGSNYNSNDIFNCLTNNNGSDNLQTSTSNTASTTATVTSITTTNSHALQANDILAARQDQQFDDYGNRFNLLLNQTTHNSRILNTNSNATNYNHDSYMMNNLNMAAAAAAVAHHNNTTAYHQPVFTATSMYHTNVPNQTGISNMNTQPISTSPMQNFIYPWMRNAGGMFSLIITIASLLLHSRSLC
jgi:hypothetical protein